MDNRFGPLEGCGRRIVGFDEVIDRAAELPRRSETRSSQRLPTENAEPNLDLIQPGGVRWGVVKANVWMAPEPTVVLGPMSIQIVQHDVDFALRMCRHNPVHEVQEFSSTTALIVSGLNLARSHIKGSKQRGRAMTLVTVAETVQGFPVR